MNEMAWPSAPLQIFWWQQIWTLEFWITIAASPDKSFFHTILLDRIDHAFSPPLLLACSLNV